jgi:anti-sigma-K factor RskA
VRGHRHQWLHGRPVAAFITGKPMLRKSSKILRKDTTMTAPEIQQEIERTQGHLGETVDELAARADVKARARARAAIIKDKAAEMSGQLRQSQLAQGDAVWRRWPLVAAAAGAVLIGSILVRRRRRR